MLRDTTSTTTARTTKKRKLLPAFAIVMVSMLMWDLAGSLEAADDRTWFVAPWGDDGGAGDADDPYRTVNHAVRVATSGDTVVLRGGDYPESVQVYNEAIALTSAEGERAVLRGGGTGDWGIYLNDADGSSLTNITVTGYATPDSDIAAVRVYSDDVVVSGVSVEGNSRIGLSAIGNDIFVTDSRFTENGHLGVHGHQLDGFVVQNSAILGNNTAGNDPFHSAGGLKVTNSSGVTVANNDISDNQGPGIWTDLSTEYVTIYRNIAERNLRSGIQIELSNNVNVLSNVVLDNGEAGVWVIESRDTQVLHNASFGNQNAIEVEEGPRQQVSNVRIKNNTLGAAASGSRALLDVNDWTEERSAHAMGVSVDHNAFWVAPGSATPNLSRWGDWPTGLAYADSIDEHRDHTDQAGNSIVRFDAANPYVRNAAAGDYRAPEWMSPGASVSGDAAVRLGAESGASRRIGPVATVTRR